eukprot:COSAG02_NODE_4075_length_5828_cov_9.864200_2_plen_453_part_00
MVAQATGTQWFWKGKRGWETFDDDAVAALEKAYREHKMQTRGVKQEKTARRSLDTVEDHRYSLDPDHTVSFAQMRQYRTYGDPSWFRSIHRGVPNDMPKSSAAPAADSKSGRVPRPPAKKGAQQRTGSGRTLAERRAAEGWGGDPATAADAWVQEGAVRKNEMLRRAKGEARRAGGEFTLRVLPCQDTRYKDVSSDMVRWFKLADEDPGASKAAAASRKPNTPENIRHLQRSLRQARVYKNVQSASTVNLQAAAAQEANGFDMVDCFALPSEAVEYGQGSGQTPSRSVGLTGMGNIVESELGTIPPPPQSQSARAVQAGSEVDLATERDEPWSARNFGTGTNWSQTKKPRVPPKTHGRQHIDAVTRSHQVPNQPHTGVRPERSWASSSEASSWATAVLGPSAADAGTPRAGTGVGALPPIAPPTGVTGEVVMSQRPRIVYKFSPRYSTFNAY